MRVYGWRTFLPSNSRNAWNTLDFVLVIFTGIIFGWIIPLVAGLAGLGSESSFIRTLTVLRAVRLLRVMRVIRKVQVFREVWLLLKGLADSIRILIWTCVVIFCVTYIFAVFGLWIISRDIHDMYAKAHDGAVREKMEVVLTWVGGLGPLIRTLIQFLTLDSWNAKMELIMEYAPWCYLYFYTYISVAVFVLMNLVTAIIVENATSTSKQDEDIALRQKEFEKHRELKEMRNLFSMMDTDGDGMLDWDEFQKAFSDPELSTKFRLLDFRTEECRELFELLDDGGGGGIERDEFFNGLSKMQGTAQSRDLVRVTKTLERLSRTVGGIASAMGVRPGGRVRDAAVPRGAVPEQASQSRSTSGVQGSG
uniref:EF-hand domain-containing protein n=1 Tax=Pyrodinium bahamense TaxID=73915 RepID=A0A7S0AY88_9DINO|mmetsp:Transcript_44699/g.124288  ORF Transcript_44699/g.124288 Transcript_44699/m.124288 type:complete len:365 (+) Transcript_44699:2-1096(+)